MRVAGWGHGYSVALLCLFGYTNQTLSILFQIIAGFTLPTLPDGGQVQISVIVTSGRYSEESRAEKIPRVYLVQETSDCVPGSLVTLAVEPP